MSMAVGGLVAFGFRILNLLISFGLVLVTSRELGDAGRGTFVLGATAVGIVIAVTGGLTAATAYQVSNRGRDPAAVLVSGAVPAVAIAAIAGVAGLLGRDLLPGDAGEIAGPVGLAAAAIALIAVVSGVLLGREAFVRYNISLVLPPGLAFSFVAATLLLTENPEPPNVLYSFAAGHALAFPLLLALGWPGVDRSVRLVRWDLVAPLLTFGLMAAISGTISYLNYRADLFVVEHFEGRAGVGVYGNAVYAAEAIWHVSGSLALATYARLGTSTPEDAAALTARVMRHTLVVLGAACVALFVSAGVIVDVLFGEEFAGMTSALRILLPGTLVYGLAASMSGFFTYQQGRPWLAAFIAGLALTIDIVLAIVLVPSMGVDGAALATTISYGVAIVLAGAIFVRTAAIDARSIFRFGRDDLDDYRRLLGRLWTALG